MAVIAAGRYDRNAAGTHFSDRMRRIMDVCREFGLASHDVKLTGRNGSIEIRTVEDITPVPEIVLAPGREKYGLRVTPRNLAKVQGLAREFAYALNVPLASIEIDGNILYVCIPRDRTALEVVDYATCYSMARLSPGMVLLGQDDAGAQLRLDLTKPGNTHAACIGMTGSGKTSLMLAMALSALQVGAVSVALFDPVGDLEPLSGHDNVWCGGLFRDPKDIEAGLAELARAIGTPVKGTLFAFLDEVPEMVARRPATMEIIGRLAQAGRHAGIHLVLGAQNPLTSELGSNTLRNIPVRLVGQVTDKTAAYNATGRGDTGAEKLPGQGAFVYVNSDVVVRFQAAYVNPATLRDWAARYPPRMADVPEPKPVSVFETERDETPSQAPTRHNFVQVQPDLGDVGRPMDDIDPEVIRAIKARRQATGKWPSQYWIYHYTRDTLPSGGYNRFKAQRALAAAGKE